MNSFNHLDGNNLKDNQYSLSVQINQCLNQLDLDDHLDIPGEDHIIRPVIKPSSSRISLHHNVALSLEEFKQQLKAIIREGQVSPVPKTRSENLTGGPNDQDHCMTSQKHASGKGLGGHSTKSRQVSIHTNAFLPTDCGDNLSIKQEMYSTAQTIIKTDTTQGHIRNNSNNKQSFFNQTNNSFISIEGSTPINQQKRYSKQMEIIKQCTQEFESEINLEKFQQSLLMHQSLLDQNKKDIQKRLINNDVKLRRNIKKKIKPFVEDAAQVPMSIYFNLVTYDGLLLKKFLQLSRGLRKHLLFYLFEELKSIQQLFKQRYGEYFENMGSFICQNPISFCKESGNRIDYVMKMKMKKQCKKYQGKSLYFGFQYKNQSENDKYFHGFSDARAYTIPVIPICIEDQFEISVNLLSLIGSLDIKSVSWFPFQFESQPNLDDTRDYNRFKNLTPNRDLFQKYFCDLKRVCEVEDTIIEWFDEQYVKVNSLKSHIKRRPDIDQFKDQFEILRVEVGGIDFSVWRVQMRALKNPKIANKFYQELNIEIKVLNERNMSKEQVKNEICNEVKRTGFLIDRGQSLELRPSDTVVLYLSLGGFEK